VSPAVSPCETAALVTAGDGVTFASGCEGTSLRLAPRVKVDGSWHGAGIDGPCEEFDREYRCPAGIAGAVTARVEGSSVRVRFEAATSAQVEAVSLDGELVLPGAKAWLSNGFQSWSQTGVVALGDPVSDDALQTALTARGAAEVDRYGNELSWWYSFVGGGDYSFVAGATTGIRFKPWVQISRADDAATIQVRLVSGGTGERIDLSSGGSVEGETFRVGIGSSLVHLLTEYGKAIASRRTSHPIGTLRGWNSWYELWDKVTEQDVRDNAALVQQTFVYSATQPFYVVVDDGWQQKWGEWDPNDKFPSGIDALVSDLHAAGLRAGVWIAPLLVQQDSTLVTGHPAWFVQDAVFDHTVHGPMKILDVTNPDAAAHLASVIQKLRSWNLDFLKIDFLFAGTYEGTRSSPVTGMEAYAEALRIIREAAGDDLVIVAVGAPPVASFPYVDGWRLGGDIAFEPFGPSWYFLINQARSVAGRWPLCEATLCDADPPLLRKLPESEVDVGVWVALAAGGVMFLSDDLRNLPDDRLHWQLTGSQSEMLLHGGRRIPVVQIPDEIPSTLTNAVIDHISRKSQHAIPTEWVDPHGGSPARLTINFTDGPLPPEHRAVPPHTAEEWYPALNE